MRVVKYYVPGTRLAVTSCLAVALLPFASVAVHVTVIYAPGTPFKLMGPRLLIPPEQFTYVFANKESPENQNNN